MHKNTNITLDTHFEAFIHSQIDLGRFANANEAIHAGLQLLEERETKLDMLRQLLIDGEKSGFAPYSLDTVQEELDKDTL
jgi:antitoxin ParD1/3/4